MIGLRKSLVTWLLICAVGLTAVGVIAALAPADPLLLGAASPCAPTARAGPPPGQPDCLRRDKGL